MILKYLALIPHIKEQIKVRPELCDPAWGDPEVFKEFRRNCPWPFISLEIQKKIMPACFYFS